MLFKKRKQQTTEKAKGRTSLVSIFIRGYQQLQHSWVKCMEQTINRFSLKTQKVVFVGIMGIGVFCCSFHLLNSLTRKKQFSIQIESINTGKHIGHSVTDSILAQQRQSLNRSHRSIQQFHLYYDSLQQSHSGKKIIDSILKYHPGLPDSLSLLEKKFTNQP